MLGFNYHLSDSPDSTSCLPRLSPVDLEITPPPSPCMRHIFPVFFKDSGSVKNQLLLLFYFEIKATASGFTADSHLISPQENGCSQETAVLKS